MAKFQRFYHRIFIYLATPTNWKSGSDITVKTVFQCDNTGLVDLETAIARFTEANDSAETTVQAFTNTNLTWASANTTYTLTTTIAAASIAAGYHFRIALKRNTGDANTGAVYFVGVRAYTTGTF